jgi:lipid II:glycine glycyltransferase (peptidoglycan interpeptide bridge formation enzyme)
MADTRAEHPGLLHLLRWRAIQLAIAAGCDEMDLGGVDVTGARRVPVKGEPMYGLYEHKHAFGAEWVEQAGAHEFVADRVRYAAGRVTQRLARELARRRRGGVA